MSIGELIKNVRQLNPTDFESFYAQVRALRESQRNPNEARLLEKINAGLPRRLRQRWDYLIARRDAEIISSPEHQELQELTAEVEKRELQRLKWLTQLADLRQMSLPQVVQEYHIQPQ